MGSEQRTKVVLVVDGPNSAFDGVRQIFAVNLLARGIHDTHIVDDQQPSSPSTGRGLTAIANLPVG
jgi:hypothetical protein